MTITELEKYLKMIRSRYGDLDVMFTDPNSPGGPFLVASVNVMVAEEDEYPEEFDMPKGFTFVHLES